MPGACLPAQTAGREGRAGPAAWARKGIRRGCTGEGPIPPAVEKRPGGTSPAGAGAGSKGNPQKLGLVLLQEASSAGSGLFAAAPACVPAAHCPAAPSHVFQDPSEQRSWQRVWSQPALLRRRLGESERRAGRQQGWSFISAWPGGKWGWRRGRSLPKPGLGGLFPLGAEGIASQQDGGQARGGGVGV